MEVREIGLSADMTLLPFEDMISLHIQNPLNMSNLLVRACTGGSISTISDGQLDLDPKNSYILPHLKPEDRTTTWLIYHNLDWFDEFYGKVKLKRNAFIAPSSVVSFHDYLSALAIVGGNITDKDRKVVYAGFGSGLWPYVCAATSEREVLAIDPSPISMSYAQSIVDMFGELPNLRYVQCKLEDIKDDIQERDTLMTMSCGTTHEDLRDDIFRIMYSKRTNLFFGDPLISDVFTDFTTFFLAKRYYSRGVNKACYTAIPENWNIAYVVVKHEDLVKLSQ